MTFYIHPSSGFEFDPPLIDASRNSEKIIIIELGSGSGMVASSLAKLLKPGYDQLIATDLAEV
jgi:methylase of polypeptide subunit release factors